MTNAEARQIVSANLKRLLSEWGWSQGDFARELFGDSNTAQRMKVSRWCSGDVLPSIAELYNIAEVANCSIDQLLEKTKTTT